MLSFLSGGTAITIQAALPDGPGPFPAIILLHGAGGNVERWFDYLAPLPPRLGFALYAVHYFDRTGTQRAAPELIRDGQHVPLWLETIHDAMRFLSARPEVDARRIALIGISLGAYLSLASAAESSASSTPQPIKAVVDISGGLPEPWASRATSSFPPTLIVHGTSDPVVPISEAHALLARLIALGVPHQTLLVPGEGHWFSPMSNIRILAAVGAFLSQHLQP